MKSRMKFDAGDLLIVLGVVGVMGGTYLISPPAMLIVAGLLCLALGVVCWMRRNK